MDLYVERQCIQEIKNGNWKQFLLLFEASFEGLYKYVFRRVGDLSEAERIVRLTYLDAISKVQETPTETSYAVWLYSLARPRIFSFINKASFPEKQGLIEVSEKTGGGGDVEKVNKMLAKLSMEEREILRLKFFEEVTDGDVMLVLGSEEGSIGAKIYRVLKRAHLLLFGESDERHGVYFGEISGLLSKVRDMEKIEVPESFRLSLRADLAGRVGKRDFAINVDAVVAPTKEAPIVSPWVKPEATEEVAARGSGDPAKIFVDAVKEMSVEEREAWRTGKMDEVKTEEVAIDELDKFEKRERVLEFFEKWKFALAAIPALLVVIVVAALLLKNVDFSHLFPVQRGYPTACSVEVDFEGDFSSGEKSLVNKKVSDRICGYFGERIAVESVIKIARKDEGGLDLKLDVDKWFLQYTFVRRQSEFRIKKYARTFNSDEESGKVSRDS